MTYNSQDMLQIVSDYKKILKRKLPFEQRVEKIAKLRLKRKQLQLANDAELYQRACSIMHDIEQVTFKNYNPATEFSGLQGYQKHLKAFLDNFTLHEGRIANRYQITSRAYLNTLQLINQVTENNIPDALWHNVNVLTDFGTTEQTTKLDHLLKQKVANNPHLQPLIDHLQQRESA